MARAGRVALADWEFTAFCFQDSRVCVNAWDGGTKSATTSLRYQFFSFYPPCYCLTLFPPCLPSSLPPSSSFLTLLSYPFPSSLSLPILSISLSLSLLPSINLPYL